MKPWQKHAITTLIWLTLPIWFIPFLLGAMVFLIGFGMYDSIHKTLWGK